jgi:hypothetical protein
VTSKAAARLLLRVRQLLLLASALLSIAWAWSGGGLVRLFEETQRRWTGRSDPFFAVLFTFLTLFVVSMAIGSVVTRLVKRRVPPEEWQSVLRETASIWDAAWRRKDSGGDSRR